MGNEPRSVAVIGMACKFPGAADPDQLWDILRNGRDATSETPPERYDVDAMYSAHPEPGTVVSRRAGYLDAIAEFDAEFFGMSPGEAADLDPQQRLLLMTAWEALEDAGQPPGELAGGRTGVYVGNTRGDFLERRFRQGLETVTASQLNNYRALLAGRLSYQLDLRGPSVLIDTACSSSLAAVHAAVQSIRAQEIPLALVAGVNIALRPDESVMMTQAGTLAHDGRSKFADVGADGFAPSDGVGVVVLKPLAAARADGDPIRAVIQGSAVGNNGRTSESLLAPSVEGQTAVLKWAYEDAGVAPSEVDFVEAHGSGAPNLDQAELEALGRVVGEGRPADRPCYVGSVKTNIGYAEGAGSIAGLIKTVLCLEHRRIPPNLHLSTPTPLIPWDELPLAVPTGLLEFPDRGRPAIAGVTGQGASCLNAHVVLREGEPLTARGGAGSAEDAAGSTYLLPLSARTPAALKELALAYARHLSPGGKGAAFGLRDICHSAATRRQHHPHRMAVAGATHAELVNALCARARSHEPGGKGRSRDVSREISRDAALSYDPALSAAAKSYLDGQDVDWNALFGAGCVFVPLPAYPWQAERYWPRDAAAGADSAGGGSGDGDDLATVLLGEHARAASDYRDSSLLSEIGIDSLARIEIIAKLAQEHRFEIDPEELASLHTVGQLRVFLRQLEAQTV
ncbi:polyketide synthase [Streptomyces sp. HNM0575]|uniref:beta-ketoacyl synthase N-terminal-like domain-containing protein n=1 Tax=Streptomyces sp. HNM0575 TaxID=2716338 RepID=UPI00145FADEA|nr:beta-ketoacyl synthase N-terminal-like domain-containing protein [Streptomyces sp. HNM0575]NLU72120.1 polyketide synthase [Streptomyces sp. HNM0575]